MLGLFQASLLYILVQCKQRPLRATTLKVLTHIESTAAALALPWTALGTSPPATTVNCPAPEGAGRAKGTRCLLESECSPRQNVTMLRTNHESQDQRHEGEEICAKFCTGVNPWHGCGCSQTRVSLFHRLSYCIFYRAAWSEQCCRFRCMWNNTLHGNRQGPPVCRLALQGVCHAWSKRPFSGSVCECVC